jgi:hypothetical protein
VCTAENGPRDFVPIVSNDGIGGQRQMCAHRNAAQTGVKLMMANAPTAKTEDRLRVGGLRRR